MMFPPLKYTLPSFENVTIVYRLTMADRPELLRFAESLTKPEEGADAAIARESAMVAIVARHLVDVESEGEAQSLSLSETERAEWLRTTFPPKAIGEAFSAILTGKCDEAFVKKS